MKEKRVAFIIPELTKGGAEKVFATVFNNLRLKEKYLIVFDKKEIHYKCHGNLLSLDIPATFSPIGKIFIFIKRFFKLKKLKKDLRIEVSISGLDRGNLLNILTKLQREKIIVSIRNEKRINAKNIYEVIYKTLLRYLYHKADLIISVSEGVKLGMIKNYKISPEKIKVIYNPSNIEFIEKQKGENIGRLSFQKGQWYLLRIFKFLKTDFPELKLFILGIGDLKEELVNYSKNLNLKTFDYEKGEVSEDYDVYFLGFQKNPYKYLARSKLFLFPSLWEGLPNAVIDALSCEVPVISSDCLSGPREVLAPNTKVEKRTTIPEFAKYGILMPTLEEKFIDHKASLSDREKMWIDTVRKILKDNSLLEHYKKVSLERAKDFSIEKIIKEWEKVILEIQ